eukprot:3520572-Pyramimonas_sp.AAC.1
MRGRLGPFRMVLDSRLGHHRGMPVCRHVHAIWNALLNHARALQSMEKYPDFTHPGDLVGPLEELSGFPWPHISSADNLD